MKYSPSIYKYYLIGVTRGSSYLNLNKNGPFPWAHLEAYPLKILSDANPIILVKQTNSSLLSPKSWD